MARRSRASRSGRGRTPRSRMSHRTGAVELFLRPQHSWWVRLLGLVVRLRAELTILAILLIARFWAWPRLDELIGHTMALIVVTVLVLSILVIPASRRYLNRRWWSITTRHRMRACFVQTRTMTHHGRLPLLVWSRPSPVGERVRVWLPAGLSVKDLERVTTETAAACWAADVRITPSRRTGRPRGGRGDPPRPAHRWGTHPAGGRRPRPRPTRTTEPDVVEDDATGTDGAGAPVARSCRCPRAPACPHRPPIPPQRAPTARTAPGRTGHAPGPARTRHPPGRNPTQPAPANRP